MSTSYPFLRLSQGLSLDYGLVLAVGDVIRRGMPWLMQPQQRAQWLGLTEAQRQHLVAQVQQIIREER